MESEEEASTFMSADEHFQSLQIQVRIRISKIVLHRNIEEDVGETSVANWN